MELTFKNYLQQELLERCRKNSNYSLRAYARSLGVEASALSKILRGKRRISKKMYAHLVQKLNLEGKELAGFEAEFSRKHEFKQLDWDTFEVISNWYYFAILELTVIEGFQSDAKWISKKLGLTVVETQIAIERLLRMGMLERQADGRLVDVSGHLTTLGMHQTRLALKRMQKQVLEMAIEKMDAVAIDQRDQTTLTVATSSKKMAQAKEKIKKFRRELSDWLEDCPTKDGVYQLSISLYPVSELEHEEEK